MARTDDGPVEQILTAYVTRVPGRVVAATALLLYPGLGLIVPLLIDLPSNWFFSVNTLTVGLAGLISVAWLLVQLERSHRRHLVDWTTNLRLLSAEEFEWFVGEVLRREGWTVHETGRQGRPDGNIDLELTQGGDRRFVQCKRWQSWAVPVDEIRAFAGTLSGRGYDGSHGIFVTLSDFTEHARDEARSQRMTLMDGQELFRRADAVRRVEACPDCARPMALGKSPYGWWFRCTSPGCNGKRHLDADAGRAVDLLTRPEPLSVTARQTEPQDFEAKLHG